MALASPASHGLLPAATPALPNFRVSSGTSVRLVGYTERMQLRIARLCLDCEEVHDAQQCPVCASEMFAPISRWVTAPERRGRPRPPVSTPRADVYRALTDPPEARPSTARKLLKSGVLGLTAVGLIGWFMRTPREREPKS